MSCCCGHGHAHDRAFPYSPVYHRVASCLHGGRRAGGGTRARSSPPSWAGSHHLEDYRARLEEEMAQVRRELEQLRGGLGMAVTGVASERNER